MNELISKKKALEELTKLRETIRDKVVVAGDFVSPVDAVNWAIGTVNKVAPMGEEVIDEDILVRSIEHYGPGAQTVVCMEELAELIQAITKVIRYDNVDEYHTHLVEELADVTICLQLLIGLYDVHPADLAGWIKAKQARIVARMEEEDNEKQ